MSCRSRANRVRSFWTARSAIVACACASSTLRWSIPVTPHMAIEASATENATSAIGDQPGS